MIELTHHQSKVLAFVKKYLKENSYPPSRREIANNFGWESNAAHETLLRLEKKGAIRLDKGKARGIIIL